MAAPEAGAAPPAGGDADAGGDHGGRQLRGLHGCATRAGASRRVRDLRRAHERPSRVLAGPASSAAGREVPHSRTRFDGTAARGCLWTHFDMRPYDGCTSCRNISNCHRQSIRLTPGRRWTANVALHGEQWSRVLLKLVLCEWLYDVALLQ
jgi:hypothetical protein